MVATAVFEKVMFCLIQFFGLQFLVKSTFLYLKLFVQISSCCSWGGSGLSVSGMFLSFRVLFFLATWCFWVFRPFVWVMWPFAAACVPLGLTWCCVRFGLVLRGGLDRSSALRLVLNVSSRVDCVCFSVLALCCVAVLTACILFVVCLR